MEYEVLSSDEHLSDGLDDDDSINLSSYALSPQEVVEFLKDDLSLDKRIKYLNLSRLGLEDDDIISIIDIIKYYPNIKCLDLSWNAFGERGAKAIMDMLLCKNSSIRNLNIEVN